MAAPGSGMEKSGGSSNQVQMPMSIASGTASTTTQLKRNSEDIGWEWGFMYDPNDKERVQCKLCGHQMGGGVHRLKEHVAGIKGNVRSCRVASKEDQQKCKQAIKEVKKNKKAKIQRQLEVRKQVRIEDDQEEDVQEEEDDNEELNKIGESTSRKRKLGPMDKFATPIDPSKPLSKEALNRMKQMKVQEEIWKAKCHEVKLYVVRWLYAHAIPFNAIDNDEFRQMCEAIGRFGPGFEGPSQYECREKLLKEEVDRTKNLLKPHEEERANSGCSIMTDAWTDTKRRSIMNLCVHCNLGTCFIDSKETNEDAHTSQYIFEFVDAAIDQVGATNVVQVVTDNASNNIGAKELLKENRPNIFWSSCATHTINLMLQAIGGMTRFKKTLDQAKAFTVFVYAHHKTLALMRRHTKKRDIIRPGVTRFASAFLTLQSLIEKKSELRAMALSPEWEGCIHSKKQKGKTATATLLSRSFWNGVSHCLKIFEPLVKVLRMVDGDSPSMAFVYGELLEAKKKIMQATVTNESNAIFEHIDRKMKDRLNAPLHLTAYFLNPYYSYHDASIFLDSCIMDGVFDCVETFFYGDDNIQTIVLNDELPKFKKQQGAFGKLSAKKGCEKITFNPANWWETFGCHVPHLQRLAIRILSLTSSSSGCERNWSTFDMIHTKKRNRLGSRRLNHLVYVQFNTRLLKRREKSKKKNVDVLLASDAFHAQGWISEGADDEEFDPISGLSYDLIDEAAGASEAMQPRRSARVRELHEDDFHSETKEEEEGNEDDDVEFESDKEEVIETKEYEQEEDD